MAGYSGTPLAQKLGIKPGTTVVLINAPANYRKLLGSFANGVEFTSHLPLGFVDIKICAIDETWSGLKLMIRRENRRSAK